MDNLDILSCVAQYTDKPTLKSLLQCKPELTAYFEDIGIIRTLNHEHIAFIHVQFEIAFQTSLILDRLDWIKNLFDIEVSKHVSNSCSTVKERLDHLEQNSNSNTLYTTILNEGSDDKELLLSVDISKTEMLPNLSELMTLIKPGSLNMMIHIHKRFKSLITDPKIIAVKLNDALTVECSQLPFDCFFGNVIKLIPKMFI